LTSFTLGINLAIRISDLLGLKVKDVKDKKGGLWDTIRIREQKTNREAKLAVNEASKEALELYFEKNFSQDPEKYLFASGKTNQPLTRQRAWQLVKDWTSMVGLTGEYGCHTLRKTFGYQGWRMGISTELLQEKLGHRSPEATRRYSGITRDQVRDVELKVHL